MKKALVDKVLAQIAKDIEAGDMTAIEELIADIPDDKAMHFLPEEQWENNND
jgi:phage gp29-like protein